MLNPHDENDLFFIRFLDSFPYTRKPETFEKVNKIGISDFSLFSLKEIIPTLKIEFKLSPCDNIPLFPLLSFRHFLLQYEEKTFLINPEGYDYFRYVVELVKE